MLKAIRILTIVSNIVAILDRFFYEKYNVNTPPFMAGMKRYSLKDFPNYFNQSTGQLILVPSGGKANYPFSGVISKLAPLGSDAYSLLSKDLVTL